MKLKSFFAGLICLTLLFSCSKDDTPTPVTDPEQILTSGVWKIDEIRFLQTGSQILYYKRGATGNTVNFDTESIKFNSDHTGTYIAGGITYNLTWAFVDATKTKLTFTVAYSTPLVLTWENIIYTESSIQYTEYYNRNGVLSLGIATRKH